MRTESQLITGCWFSLNMVHIIARVLQYFVPWGAALDGVVGGSIILRNTLVCVIACYISIYKMNK